MPLWSHDQRESVWQIEKSVSPLSRNLWPLNLASRWLQQGDSARKALSHHRLLICTFDCKVKFYFSPRRHLKRWVFFTLNIYIIFIYISIYLYIERHKVAIESWHEWDYNLWLLNFVQKLSEPHNFNWHSEPTLYTYSNLISCSDFILAIAFISCNINHITAFNHISVVYIYFLLSRLLICASI